MQPASVRRRLGAGVFDLDGDVQSVGGEAIFDRQAKREGIDRAGLIIVAQHKAHEIAARRLDLEILPECKSMQAQSVLASRHARAVARPADHGIEDRADPIPDRRIARPQEVAPVDAPETRLRAVACNDGARAGARQRDLACRQGTSPLIAAVLINASLTPGAQATSGLPSRRPSPARKSLT